MSNPGHKTKSLSELAAILLSLRRDGKKIVLCHGVFDLLHIGHIRYFDQARRAGDVLVVTVTPDRFVDKGPHRPAFNQYLRAEAIASLGSVDFVAINEWPTAEKTLRLLKPDVYAKGSEFKRLKDDPTGKILLENKVVEEIGARLFFSQDIVFSSSNLINRYLSDLPREIRQYLELFRQRYGLEDVLALVNKMAALKVLVVGDTIIDAYQYCEAIGKSSKDPTLALKYQSEDRFVGGAVAVANHVADFAGSVKLVSVLGQTESQEAFIKNQLHPNVSPWFLFQADAPTPVKRRFIDGYSFNKLFEVYVMQDDGLSVPQETQLKQQLKQLMPQYDLIIAADFGHGAISAETARLLSRHSGFLAVNTQANAGNRGFHTVSRYPRADYVCIAEHELRLETRLRNGDIAPMLQKITKALKCRQMVVTRGRRGCLVCDADQTLMAVPAFAEKIVDRVGAGDAFLSLTCLAAALGADSEVLGFLGNIAGSLAVQQIGNKKSLDQASVQKYITALMK